MLLLLMISQVANTLVNNAQKRRNHGGAGWRSLATVVPVAALTAIATVADDLATRITAVAALFCCCRG